MRATIKKTLKSSKNFHMPAEWEEHDATFLSWPTNKETWPKNLLTQVEDIYLQMILALTKGEKVFLLVDDLLQKEKIANRLLKQGIIESQIQFLCVPTADTWIRDYGPIFVKNKDKLAMTNWRFNAWGEKYFDLTQDTQVNHYLFPQFNQYDHISIDFVLEGGSIDVNGKGTLLTTKQCLLNQNRNPKYSQKEIENILMENLGAENIIWLNKGIVGDDTDGHIDDIARFVNPSTIVCALEEDKKDENFTILKENFHLLQAAKDQEGNNFEIVALPMPGNVCSDEGRLPASYANFYIANEVVLVPTYGSSNDKIALDTLQNLFPDKQIIDIYSAALVWGLGSIHCVTQQVPKKL